MVRPLGGQTWEFFGYTNEVASSLTLVAKDPRVTELLLLISVGKTILIDTLGIA